MNSRTLRLTTVETTLSLVERRTLFVVNCCTWPPAVEPLLLDERCTLFVFNCCTWPPAVEPLLLDERCTLRFAFVAPLRPPLFVTLAGSTLINYQLIFTSSFWVVLILHFSAQIFFSLYELFQLKCFFQHFE